MGHCTSRASNWVRISTCQHHIITIKTCWPLNIRFTGEHVVRLAGEGHVPLVEVVLEPVVGGPSIADIEDGLSVCGGIVRVPLQQQVVLTVRLGWLHTV